MAYKLIKGKNTIRGEQIFIDMSGSGLLTDISASHINTTGLSSSYIDARFLSGSPLTISASVVSASTYLGLPDFDGNPAGSNTEIQFNSGSVFGSSPNLTFDYNTNTLTVSGTLQAQNLIVSSSQILHSGSTIFGDDVSDTHQFTGSIYNTTLISGSEAQFTILTSSVVSASTYYGLPNTSIIYVSESTSQTLTEIEVADYHSEVAVTFVDGRLKFIFGTPTIPSSVAVSLSGFATDRFNQIQDNYTVNGSWSNGAYTLVSASLYEGSTLLTEVSSGTSLSYNTTTSGSHTYVLYYTASSPLDGTLYSSSVSAAGTLSKTNPAAPTLTTTADVQLGATSYQIEEGATGSISFTSSSANPSNAWLLDYVTTNYESPIEITGSMTGSTSIAITATAYYYSPIGDNNPDLTTTTSTTKTYTKIRSLRYGASSASSFTINEMVDLAFWDTSLGGTIGTIDKGNTNPTGDAITISWSGDKYHYIVFDSSRSNLTNITTSGFSVLNAFTITTVGNYKIYRTTTLQAGGASSSITYVLT